MKKEKKLKIAMFGHKQIPSRSGGVEVVVEELSVRMAKLGHDVTCYNRGGAKVCDQGVCIKTVPTIPVKGFAAVISAFFAAFAVAFSRADVCHIHAEGPAFMSFLPKLFGKRVIVTVHGLDWQREKWRSGFGAAFIRMGEKMAVRFADEIIVLSRHAQEYFRRAYGRTTHYIPNGVTKPTVRPPQRICAQLGLQGGDYLLYLGRLVPEKGVHDLIGAFKGLKTDKHLVIAGASSDTDAYVKELKALSCGDDRILFTGFVQGALLEELYSNAYLYVLPSILEGMPLSLLEAMSYGCCCVVSDIPECTEIVEDHAAIFPKGDAQALRRTLQHLCDDAQRAEHFRRGARDFVSGRYDWDEVTKKTLELYYENSDRQ